MNQIKEFVDAAIGCTIRMVIPHLAMWQYEDNKRFRPKKHRVDYFWP